VYGNETRIDPAESVFRILRTMSEQGGFPVPALAQVKTVLSEHDLTGTQTDALMDRIRGSYRPGGRTSPWNYFCNTLGKNGF